MNDLRYLLPLSFLMLLIVAGCDSPSGVNPDDEGDVDVTENVDVELPVDPGEVGVVIDVRAIARKGYVVTEADVAFPSYARFDATLAIDAVTNLAVLNIPNESLTEEEKEAFASGITATITIYGEGQDVLAERQESELVLDDSNAPLYLDTDRPPITPPLELKEGIPYLLQPENRDGLLTSTEDGVCIGGCASPITYGVADYLPESGTQQFYFAPRTGSAGSDTYVIQHFGYDEGTFWFVDEVFDTFSGTKDILKLGNGTQPLPPDGPQAFVLEQDDDGWVKIRVAGTQEYVQASTEMRIGSEGTRFRLISDNIDWTVTDRGTVYHQPVTPPAQLDFAYEATIRNCSPATLTETIGKSDSRTRSSTTATTESLQLFSSSELSVGLTVGVEVGTEVPSVGEVKGSVEASTEYTYTTSQTTSTENTVSKTTEETSEVSRTRELEVPPSSAVEVYDAVRTIKNVRVPFTQVLRITATYDEDGSALTGSEILTQMLFNFVTGVPSAIGNEYVDVSLRGHVLIDQLFESETNVSELSGSCD